MKFLPRSAAALAVAAMFPLMAAAQQPAPEASEQQGQRAQGRGMARQGAPMRQAANRPQLTDAQREQVRALNDAQQKIVAATRRELGDLNRQLTEQLGGAQIDTAKVTALRTAIVQKETALAEARVDRQAKLASILTAEQRQAMGVRGQRGQAPRGMRGQGAPGGRAMMQRRPGLQGQRGLRGVAPGARGGAALRQRGGDVQLRAEIRRLERQLELLRRRIR